jgi:hypothetical protein
MHFCFGLHSHLRRQRLGEATQAVAGQVEVIFCSEGFSFCHTSLLQALQA